MDKLTVEKSIQGWQVLKEKDGGHWEVVKEFETNAEAYAWMDRMHRRPLWKSGNKDFWVR
jgi:hypothetical protein